MLTRLKRRMGQRDLWDVIVNSDDVCFKYILPKLNQTDLKFLHDVNSETRALIKRSSRKGELKSAFKIREMTSISTLEIAWENSSLWPGWWSERSFCWSVARTNKLELLKWAREEKKCEWDTRAIEVAASQGNLEMVKYCVANLCPIYMSACANAARNGHLECLKYLHEEAKALWDSETAARAAQNGHLHILEYLVEREYKYFHADACRCAARNCHLDCLKFLHETAKAPWDWMTAKYAAENGHLHILKYLIERKYDKFRADTCLCAAMNGHLDCLKFLHETAKAPWDSYTLQSAHDNNQSECLQYLLDNDCPLPYGWRYEHGVLYTS